MPYEIINAYAYLNNRVKDGSLTQEDADLIYEFCEERKATKHITESTALATSKSLSKFAISITPFKQCTTLDVIKAINSVEKIWKQNTRRLRIYYLKEFLHWLVEEGHNSTINIKKLDSIKPPLADKATKTASQMIPEEKIDEMIKSCKNSRDRALIAFMYEGALRPIEVREATWDQIKFDQYGAIFTTAKKTGKPRYIRLIRYSGYLAAWRSDYHPGKPDGNAWVFVTNQNNKISRQYFQDIIANAAKAAGLKGVFPYILRHSRITAMVAQKIPESVIKLQAWGSLATPMMQTYTHLSNDQMDDVLLETSGVKRVGRPTGPSVKPVQCPHCNTVNVPGAQYCHRCGRELTEEARDIIDVIREAKDNPDILIEYANWRQQQLTKQK